MSENSHRGLLHTFQAFTGANWMARPAQPQFRTASILVGRKIEQDPETGVFATLLMGAAGGGTVPLAAH